MIAQSPIVIGIYFLLTLGAGLSVWGWLQVESFLKAHDSIDSPSVFDEFKRIVKSNMFLALAILVIVGLILLLGGISFHRGEFTTVDLQIIFLILGHVCAFAGIRMTAAENRMKALPVEDETLHEEFAHVVTRWTSHAFPDW